MQKLEENLKRREAVSAGNGDKIEDETRKHLEFYSKSYDDLTKFKSEMINELRLYKSQLNVIAGQVESISTAIEESLRYSYQYNVKLIGIPEMNQNESATETTNICCNLFNKIGVKVNESDIDIAHRVPGRNAKPVSQLIWTPVDLDPRSISTSRFGPPGPNLLVDMDPRGSKSTSKYGPPLADLDPLQKLNICNVNTII